MHSPRMGGRMHCLTQQRVRFLLATLGTLTILVSRTTYSQEASQGDGGTNAAAASPTTPLVPSAQETIQPSQEAPSSPRTAPPAARTRVPNPPAPPVAPVERQQAAPAIGLDAVKDEERAELASAKLEAAVSKLKEEIATQKAEDAIGAKAVTENAKLLKSGITIGVSAGLQFPLFARKGTSLQQAAFVGMPYVLILPGYWGGSDARREYCATAWGGGGESEATSAAMEVARRKALTKFEAFVNSINAGLPDSQILAWDDVNVRVAWEEYEGAEIAFKSASDELKKSDNTLSKKLLTLQALSKSKKPNDPTLLSALQDFNNARTDYLASQEAFQDAAQIYLKTKSPDPTAILVAETRIWQTTPPQDPDARDVKKASIINSLANTEWNSNLRGKCWWTRFGGFIGMPLGNEVRAKVRGIGIEKRDFNSHLAFGITFTPNAYVSLLLGVTVGEVTRKESETTTPDPRTVWAGNFSLGGNFDLAAALLKGAQSIP